MAPLPWQRSNHLPPPQYQLAMSKQYSN